MSGTTASRAQPSTTLEFKTEREEQLFVLGRARLFSSPTNPGDTKQSQSKLICLIYFFRLLAFSKQLQSLRKLGRCGLAVLRGPPRPTMQLAQRHLHFRQITRPCSTVRRSCKMLAR